MSEVHFRSEMSEIRTAITDEFVPYCFKSKIRKTKPWYQQPGLINDFSFRIVYTLLAVAIEATETLFKSLWPEWQKVRQMPNNSVN